MRTSHKPIRAAALALAATFAVAPAAAGQGYLGIEMSTLTADLRDYFGAPKNAGTLVAKVTENSAAAAAGFEVGDVITKIADEPVGSPGDVVRVVAQSDPGEQITVEVVRYGAPVTLNATLGARPGSSLAYFDYHPFIEDLQRQHRGMIERVQREHQGNIRRLQQEHHNNISRVREEHIGTGRSVPTATGQGYLGLETMDLSPDQRVHFGAPRNAGSLVIQVVEDSPAAGAGFKVRDVVTAIAGYPVGNNSELVRALAQWDPGDRITVEVVRHGTPVTLNVTLGAREEGDRDSRQRPAGVGEERQQRPFEAAGQGQQQADAMMRQAQQQADAMMRQAQQRADEMMRQAQQRADEITGQAGLGQGGIIGRLQQEHQSNIGRLRREHQSNIGRLRREHHGNIGRLRREHHGNIRGLRRDYIGAGRRDLAACVQDEQPRGVVNVDVGDASVSLDYGRPVVGDRTLGEMLEDLSEDWVWRAGENRVTTLETTGPLRIGSETVPEGRYSLYLHFAESGDGALLVNRHQGIALGELWPEAPEDEWEEPWPILDGYGQIEDQEQARIPLEKTEASGNGCVFEITADEGMLRFAWGGVAFQTPLASP